MITESEIAAAAEALRAAEADQTPIRPLAEVYPDLDIEAAYAIQQANVAHRTAAGAQVKGHKVGLTSRAMQEALGVDEPDFGHLLDDMFVFEDAEIPVAGLCAPRVEIEVAFVLSRPLAGPGVNAADVLRATELLLPSIEVIDSRIRDWNIRLVDTVADNASAARIVLGGRPVRPYDVDLQAGGAVLHHNGTVAETGTTAAVLGNPVTAVAWLANRVAAYGITLDAGHVVLPGACTRAVAVGPDDVVVAEFEGLGKVRTRFV